jgi:hypothetical protein
LQPNHQLHVLARRNARVAFAQRMLHNDELDARSMNRRPRNRRTRRSHQRSRFGQPAVSRTKLLCVSRDAQRASNSRCSANLLAQQMRRNNSLLSLPALFRIARLLHGTSDRPKRRRRSGLRLCLRFRFRHLCRCCDGLLLLLIALVVVLL